MSFRDLAATALGNLGRHKARTVLTTIGVVVGILTIVTMVSLGIGVRGEMRKAFGSIGLETVRLFPVADEADAYDPFGQPQRTKLLTRELIEEVEGRAGVKSVEALLALPGAMRIGLAVGDQETRVATWDPGPAYVPEPFAPAAKTLAGLTEAPVAGGGVVVDAEVLRPLGYEEDALGALVGQAVELILYAPRGESESFTFTIAGIVDRVPGDIRLALPDKVRLLAWWYNDPEYLERRGYDEVTIRATDLRVAGEIVDWLDAQGYRVQSVKAMLDLANRGMIVLQTMLGSVGGLALLVASLGIANTMIMAVYERTREIGVLKAVGAAPGQIRSLFVAEASLIGLLGGVIGTVGGWLLGKGLNWLIHEILRWQEMDIPGTFFVVAPWLAGAALGFATVVGLLAGLYPAARAARLAPLDALRYE